LSRAGLLVPASGKVVLHFGTSSGGICWHGTGDHRHEKALPGYRIGASRGPEGLRTAPPRDSARPTTTRFPPNGRNGDGLCPLRSHAITCVIAMRPPAARRAPRAT